MKNRNDTALLCLSSRSWEEGSHRTKELMWRCAAGTRLLFCEPPAFHHGYARLEVYRMERGIERLAPKLSLDVDAGAAYRQLARYLDTFLKREGIERVELWYDDVEALQYTRHLLPHASLTVYDVTQRPATPNELMLERELLPRADLVFTGGESMYQALRLLHRDVHAFPSAVDVPHFMTARIDLVEPADQAALPRPRLGYWGPIDGRVALELVKKLAELCPDWQLVMLGPSADPASLPQRPNLHWLGAKTYDELPEYIAGWDVGILPVVINETTKFLTPAHPAGMLAAGRALVSTPLTDVVNPYEKVKLVRTARTAEGFMVAVKAALAEERSMRQQRADAFLSAMSWDTTWSRMNTIVEEARARRLTPPLLRAA